jgi:general stress protein 26
MATTDPHALAKLWDMIKEIEVAMMTTVDADGSLRSRPMWTQHTDFDGILWFFTRADAPKSSEVGRDHRVNLSYAQPNRQNYVSVSGTAELIRDRGQIAALWSESLTTWFPKGLKDPELALLRIRVERAEYWDAPSSAMVHAYGYVKAKLTGEPPHPGHQEKVKLR